MIYKNKPECVTIGTWLPKDDADELLKIANRKTEETGRWWSVSHLLREIVSKYLEADNGERA